MKGIISIVRKTLAPGGGTLLTPSHLRTDGRARMHSRVMQLPPSTPEAEIQLAIASLKLICAIDVENRSENQS